MAVRDALTPGRSVRASSLPPEFTEFRYRQLHPNYTHDMYLDEPAETVSWELAIADVHAQVEAEQARKK